jgi:enamine deaminase RidA (YjgF/YER057c/UK114 family)
MPIRLCILLIPLMCFLSISIFGQNAHDPEAKLKELQITLSAPARAQANYVPCVRSGNLLFLAGAGPLKEDGTYITGKVGQDASVEDAYLAARLVAIRQMGVIKAEIGDLKKVKRIVKVLGMVNSTDTFDQQPAVINGFSDLMTEVFGEKGRHARSSIGVNALPWNMLVEIEMIVEIED